VSEVKQWEAITTVQALELGDRELLEVIEITLQKMKSMDKEK
jgi:hypothetical protein